MAGSTGTNSATARLIATVSKLAHGAVVLPGLDQRLDETSWRLIGALDAETDPIAGHPQAALRTLLDAIGIDRAAVRGLGAVAGSRVARPADRRGSEAGRHDGPLAQARRGASLDIAAALDGVTLIEAADENEEARAIAVALRETLEGTGTAALVTPDRELARRVREELMRWDIDIEESSGEPLGQTAKPARWRGWSSIAR